MRVVHCFLLVLGIQTWPLSRWGWNWACFFKKPPAILRLLGLRCALRVGAPARAPAPPAGTSSTTSMASSGAKAPLSNSGYRPCTKLSLGPFAFKVEHGGRGKPEIRQQEVLPAQHAPIRSNISISLWKLWSHTLMFPKFMFLHFFSNMDTGCLQIIFGKYLKKI